MPLYVNGTEYVGVPAGLINVSPLELYVRAVDGSDSNGGQTPLDPLETLQAAVDKIPYIVHDRVIIHAGAHTGDGYELPVFRERVLREHIYVIGDGGGAGGDDGFTEIVASTAALAGSTQFEVKASGLSASEFGGFGEHFGRTIEILTGAAAGDRRTISWNTTDTYYPGAAFSAAIAEGDTYRIVEPAIQVKTTGSSYGPRFIGCGSAATDFVGYPSGYSKSVWLVNFKNATGQTLDLHAEHASVVLCGIQVHQAYVAGAFNFFKAGWEAYPSTGYPYASMPGAVALGAVSEESWVGWGLSSRRDHKDALMLVTNASKMHGVFAFGEIIVSYDAELGMIGGAIQGDGLRIGSGRSQLYMWAGILGGRVRIGGSRTSIGITFAASSRGTLYGYVPSGDALVIHGESHAIQMGTDTICYQTIGGSNVVLEGVAGNCVRCKYGGIYQITNQLPTCTSGAGDISADNGVNAYPISTLSVGSIIADLNHGKIQFV